MSSVTVSAPCDKCGTTTSHRGDKYGVLRCVRCVLDTSLPPSEAPMSDPSVVAVQEARKPRSVAEIVAAIITVLVLGFLAFAIVKGR